MNILEQLDIIAEVKENIKGFVVADNGCTIKELYEKKLKTDYAFASIIAYVKASEGRIAELEGKISDYNTKFLHQDRIIDELEKELECECCADNCQEVKLLQQQYAKSQAKITELEEKLDWKRIEKILKKEFADNDVVSFEVVAKIIGG